MIGASLPLLGEKCVSCGQKCVSCCKNCVSLCKKCVSLAVHTLPLSFIAIPSYESSHRTFGPRLLHYFQRTYREKKSIDVRSPSPREECVSCGQMQITATQLDDISRPQYTANFVVYFFAQWIAILQSC